MAIGENLEKGKEANHFQDLMDIAVKPEQFDMGLGLLVAVAIQGTIRRPAFLFDDPFLTAEEHGNGMQGDDPGAAHVGQITQVQ